MSASTSPVTVVVPCLNAEATLAEALESVLDQTARPLEVLVIDDGSRDRSVEIARSFGARVLRNPTGSTSGARNLGTSEARGAYVTFCDSDDLLELTKIERQLAVLERLPENTFVHTGAMLFWDDARHPARLRASGEAATGRCTRVVFERNPVCGSSVMARRSTLLQLGNYDTTVAASEDFLMSLVASTWCDFVYLPQPLYRIRRHAGNMTNRKCNMAYFHWLSQEKFRLRCPEAFADLPAESVRQCMVEPVLRAAKEAYWRRDSIGYRRLLRLAWSLAPNDPEIRRQWRRRHVPMRALRARDSFVAMIQRPAAEST